MANWARTQREECGLPVVKRDRYGIHFLRPDGLIEADFSGSPCHYDEGGIWKELDTTLQWLTDHWGAPGIATRIAADRTVTIGAYSQRTTRVGLLRGTTFTTKWTVPVGAVQDDSLVATGTIGGANWEHRLRLTETGLRETLTLDSKPTISGVQAGDWLVLETVITGKTFTNGWLDEYTQEGQRFPLPEVHDANGKLAECRRYARRVSGVQYIYTGIPVSYLASAVYPIVIDPDYLGETADGQVRGINGTYATARSTSTDFSITGTTLTVGQDAGYLVGRAFLKFDTGGLPDAATITQVNMTLSVETDASTTDFNIEIMKYDWSGNEPIAAGTREAAYDGALASTKDVTWRNSNGIVVNTVYTSPNMDVTWVSKTGSTYYALVSAEDIANSQPANAEYVTIRSQNYATASKRPILQVVYTFALTATGISVSPTLGTPTLVSQGDLDADAISVSGVLGTPTLAQESEYDLDAVGLSVSGVLGTATLVCVAALGAVSMAVSGILGTPTIVSQSDLTATGISVSATMGTPTLVNVATLTTDSISASPVLGTPTIVSQGDLTADGLSSSGILGTPTLAYYANLVADGLSVTGVLGAPTLVCEAALTADGLSMTGVLGTPTIVNVFPLDAVGMSVSGTLGTPALTNNPAMTALWLTAQAWLDSPTLVSVATLDASGLSVSPTLGTPTLVNVFPLDAMGISVSPFMGTPAIVSQADLTATGLAVTGVLGTPTLVSEAHLAATGISASPFMGTPVIVSQAVLTANGLSVAAFLGTPTLVPVATLDANDLTVSSFLGTPTIANANLLDALGLSVTGVLGSPTLVGYASIGPPIHSADLYIPAMADAMAAIPEMAWADGLIPNMTSTLTKTPNQTSTATLIPTIESTQEA